MKICFALLKAGLLSGLSSGHGGSILDSIGSNIGIGISRAWLVDGVDVITNGLGTLS
jgi:hypothetical protein